MGKERCCVGHAGISVSSAASSSAIYWLKFLTDVTTKRGGGDFVGHDFHETTSLS